MRRLILFARRPLHGRVKTRLGASLHAGAVLDLYRAFVEDQIRFLGAWSRRVRVELRWDAPYAGPEDRAARRAGVVTTSQGTGDLGGRLARAFRDAASRGSRATVVIGTDSPTLPAWLVQDAFDRLDRVPAVISAADDGGFVLLGLCRPHDALFRGIPWGGPRVLAATTAAARREGLPMARLEGWYDVDDASGVMRLRRELRHAGARARAPATARCLSLIPEGAAASRPLRRPADG